MEYSALAAIGIYIFFGHMKCAKFKVNTIKNKNKNKMIIIWKYKVT